MRRDARQAISVLKVGGSVLTDRRRYCALDRRAIRRLAAALAGWLPSAPDPVILIIGGGSFGHNVVARHRLSLDGKHDCPAEAFELTARLFQLKAAVARELAERRIAAMPLQETTLFAVEAGNLRLTHAAPLTRCMVGGWLPLLTGGLVPDGPSALTVVSSDRLVVALTQKFIVRRYVALTDCPGVCDLSVAGEPLVKNVSLKRRAEAEALLRPSSKVDVNGGMREKLESALELAALGVGSVIGDGRDLGPAALSALFGDDPPGTWVEPATTSLPCPPPPA